MKTGDGSFSIGNQIWPGTSKLIEEMGELQQVLGKLIATAGDTNHWSGDLRARMIEELADVGAALRFFAVENFTREELIQMLERSEKKKELFQKWHSEQGTLKEIHAAGMDEEAQIWNCDFVDDFSGEKWTLAITAPRPMAQANAEVAGIKALSATRPNARIRCVSSRFVREV